MPRYRLKLATWVVVREGSEPSPRELSDPSGVGKLAQDIVSTADDDKEHFWAIFLDVGHRYMMHTMVFTGTKTEALVHPREIFGPALREGAVAVIVVHNHPSGDPCPSLADFLLTRRLRKVGELVGIELLDHVIVGNGTGHWRSLESDGLG